MMKTDEIIEYNTVILAALLHDIGKFLHRESAKTLNKSHQETSANFFEIEKFKTRLANDKLFNIDLLCFLVRYHHSKDDNYDNFFCTNSLDKIRVENFRKIVKKADEYSCKERIDQHSAKAKGMPAPKSRKGNKRVAPLDSIFSRINIGLSDQNTNRSARYKQTEIDPFHCFPDDTLKILSDKELSMQIGEFENNLPDFSKLNDFSELMAAWLDYLYQYLWAVPSDTRYEHSDVSLFDHLRTSAAIAACLYKKHNHILDKKSNWRKTKEFYFIGGDFSGIQNYIFDITNAGSGGAAKRLRARSAFVYMFCESAIHKILHTLELPYVCNLFSTGGKFLIIAPLTYEIEEKLKSVKSEIEKEIHKTYFNQFSFLMHWKEINRFENNFRVYEFYSIANKMFDELECIKARKACTVFKNQNDKWNEEAFRATDLYNSYKGEGDCKICRKGPAVYPESFQENEEPVQCATCYSDRNVIGLKIPKCKAIAFGKQSSKENKNCTSRITLFHGSPEYYADLIENTDDLKKENNYYLIYNFEKKAINSGNVVTRFYANHIPVDSNGNTLEFTQIASFLNDDPDIDSDSSGMLGILKADIDNLGLIFNKGFENPVEEEKDIAPHDRKTISRFLTLSRMTELFFSGWIKSSMERNNHQAVIALLESIDGLSQNNQWKVYLKSGVIDFEKIYTVYSGGDDLVLIGPWETMIMFSILLNTQFRKFTCNNPSITLSAGLTFIKPKFPAATGILQADELLNTSKEAGKNRITFFNTTVCWEQLPILAEYFLFLDNKINNSDSEINKAFLYRLLEYHKMALNYFDTKKVDGLKYISALNYDMGRNIITCDKNKKITKGKEELKALNKLSDLSSESLMKNIKIPLFWALYKNR